MTPSKEAMDLARKIYGHLLQHGDWQDETPTVANAIDAALAEREAQAVQREREAAKGLELGLQDAQETLAELAAQASGVPTSTSRSDCMAALANQANMRAKARLATYNDNRKG
jgi:hypothetical protein